MYRYFEIVSGTMTCYVFGMHTIYVIQKDWKYLREFFIHSGLLAQRRRRVWTPNLFQRDRLILVEKQKNTFQQKSTWPPRFSPFKILDFLGHERSSPQNLVLLRSQELLGVSRRPIAQNDRTGANQNQFAISRLFHSCQFVYSNFYVFFVIFSVTKWSLKLISLSK